jgi:hypothetical protein
MRLLRRALMPGSANSVCSSLDEARNETRTRDPFLTMEVLYQLSYPGEVGLLRSRSRRF